MKSIILALSVVQLLAGSVFAQAPAASAADRTQVSVLCYHRFEEKPRDGLAITPGRFEEEMQVLKDAGITVVSMQDFLAWQRGEKTLPERCALITIDDGYASAYHVAWPILKKFSYPFTMYIYTDYVKGGPKAGGGSMTWEQLAEMRDAGVDIGSHTVSHSSLTSKKSRSDAEYAVWLKHELGDSKKMLEERLGIPIRTIAYPYGNNNEVVRQAAAEAGYEAGFSVRGMLLDRGGDPMGYGRTAIDSTKPELFAQALRFKGSTVAPAASSGGGVAALAAATTFSTSPGNGETAASPLPELTVDLASFGPIDPGSIVMRVSGLGEVPAVYDAATGKLAYQLRQRLYARPVNVSVSAKADSQKVSVNWSYMPNNTSENPPVPEGAKTSRL
ncbi:MAG: hypothetical protein Fur0032_14050 [Terrimicrobiaceae bacterium]